MSWYGCTCMLSQRWRNCGCFKSDSSASDGFGAFWVIQKLQFWKRERGGWVRKVQFTLWTQKICQIQPSMFALFSPPHYTLPSPSSCSLFHLRQSPDRAGSHSRCAAHPQRDASHASHLPPHTKLNSPPRPLSSSPSPSTSCWLHQVDAKCSSGWETKLGVGVGPPWQFLNTTCSTLLQPTLRNQLPAIAALIAHTPRHLCNMKIQRRQTCFFLTKLTGWLNTF